MRRTWNKRDHLNGGKRGTCCLNIMEEEMMEEGEGKEKAEELK